MPPKKLPPKKLPQERSKAEPVFGPLNHLIAWSTDEALVAEFNHSSPFLSVFDVTGGDRLCAIRLERPARTSLLSFIPRLRRVLWIGGPLIQVFDADTGGMLQTVELPVDVPWWGLNWDAVGERLAVFGASLVKDAPRQACVVWSTGTDLMDSLLETNPIEVERNPRSVCFDTREPSILWMFDHDGAHRWKIGAAKREPAYAFKEPRKWLSTRCFGGRPGCMRLAIGDAHVASENSELGLLDIETGIIDWGQLPIGIGADSVSILSDGQTLVSLCLAEVPALAQWSPASGEPQVTQLAAAQQAWVSPEARYVLSSRGTGSFDVLERATGTKFRLWRKL